MASGLVVTTTVQTPAGSPSASQTFTPDDADIPEWAAQQMGAHCFVNGVHPVDDAGGQEPPVPPAKSGPNAGAAKWAAYAKVVGVDVPDGAKQGEIVALLEAAGKPTE